MLGGRRFSFSIIVHADAQGPLINFHQSSPILNVRADCPPSHLMEFLMSEGGVQASEAASEVHSTRQREEALLERVRQVGGSGGRGQGPGSRPWSHVNKGAWVWCCM